MFDPRFPDTSPAVGQGQPRGLERQDNVPRCAPLSDRSLRPAREAFREAWGQSIMAFEEAWKEYVKAEYKIKETAVHTKRSRRK